MVKRVIQLLLVAALILTCVCAAAAEDAEKPKISELDFAAEGYQPRRGIQTILVMGVDDYGKEMVTSGFVNYMQSDFMALLVMDAKSGKIEVLHLNRDTMAEIDRIGVAEKEDRTFVGQLALAHAYGSGGSDSNLNVTKSVSKLLGGVRIDHYMTFAMGAVPIVNDLLGGVTVTVEDDLTSIHPSLTMGSEVTLYGETALKFVQARYNVADQTNLNRMGRQRQYMTGLYQKLIQALDTNENLVTTLAKSLGDRLETDLSIYQMDALASELRNCELQPFRTIPGKFKLHQFLEYYLDPDALHDIVQELFYEPIS